jgi:DNA-binding XRE family transcriptional regulator
VWQPSPMAGNNGGNPATHFGRQLRKERLSRGWSIHELAHRTGITAGHLSRIENGKRMPTAAVAQACDDVFPERRGWFSEYVADSQAWTPPGFRVWSEYEDGASALRAWIPGVIHGLAQTEDYARAQLGTAIGATPEVIATRLAARMQRQRRTILRDDHAPATVLLVDELGLSREAGSAGVMAGQCAHLLALAGMPHVTLQVVPAVVHAALASELTLADHAAYVEHLVSGYVYTDEETVSSLSRMISAIQAEAFRASESRQIIGRTRERWMK